MTEKQMKISLVVILILLIGISFFLIIRYDNESNLPIAEEKEMEKFSSIDEIKNFVKENSFDYGFGYGMEEAKVTTTAGFAQQGGMAAASAESSRGQAAEDYSTTNIQVEGVDEPDIVKNDEKYIYVASGNRILIVDAYPAEQMQIISEINLNKSITNLFVNGNKLIALSGDYEYIDSGVSCLEGEMYSSCGGYSKSYTLVYLYDISDKKFPKLDDEIKIDGNYVDARMIDNYVYTISLKYIDLRFFEMPSYEAGGFTKTMNPENVAIVPSYDSGYNFNIVSAINLENGNINTEAIVMGYSGTIFVSQKNIYLTHQKQINPKIYFEKYISEVVLPTLPFEENAKVEEVLNSDKRWREKQQEVQEIVEEYSQGLRADLLQEFLKEYENASEKFNEEIWREMQKTVINKISIDKEKIKYENTGEVPGNVLNQFSMDEYKDYFRVATTLGNVWGRMGGERKSQNNLYVLDEDMKIIGKVEGLAEGERIYSARFFGERAYLVTFKKIDPLFVIDLSNPEEPNVLGYLKITGYSDYLHPYDENHIIGIGKETRGGNEQFSWYQGVKISLFDVSDVSNPTEKAKIEIGDRGTDSYALQDHKAFLFDKKRNLLVIPISLAEINESNYRYARQDPNSVYGEIVWQGAYVLNIDLSGISIKGKISHSEENEINNQRWYYWSNDIKRTLYIDNTLYTISDRMVKASDINTIQEINKVEWENSYVTDGVAYPNAL